MTQRTFISRFSPQRTDPEVLERIFVQRQELLEQSVAALRESALTANKHHLLFVGPRGCGKTHMLALIAHRLEKQPDLAGHLRLAWLNEDETSTSFLDLLLRIYRALSERYPVEFPLQAIETLQGRDATEALEVLRETLLARIAGHTVLVLVENLDLLFRQLEDADQRAWRAFIQNHPVFATAATAQSLFAGVSDRDQPFFGFFDTRHLQPLTVEEATQLLGRIAALNGLDPLARFLATPRGKARVQAIRHLSGGNHRLYIVLSDFITRDSLDELVRPFEEMVDDQLTPYYQERLRWLSPQQRKIVEFLCAQAGPVPVKRIAEGLFTEHSSIASQLQKLRDMGYVKPNPRGRESLYELAEPLMRLSMQVKNTRNHEPLRLIVDFLRVWFERDELERLSTRGPALGPARPYLAAALEKLKSGEPNLRQELLRIGLEDIDVAHCTPEQLEDLRLLAEESTDASDWMDFVRACVNQEHFTEANQWCGKIIEWPGAPVEQVCGALVYRGVTLDRMGRPQDKIADCTRVIDMPDAPSELVSWALVSRGAALDDLGQTQEAIADFTRAIDLTVAPAEPISLALMARGEALDKLGRTLEAIADYTGAIDLPGAIPLVTTRALVSRATALAKLGRTEEALADLSRAIDKPGTPADQVCQALLKRGLQLGLMDRTQEEISDYSRAIDCPGMPTDQLGRVFVIRGMRLGELGRNQEAIADLTRAIDLLGTPAGEVFTALLHRAVALGKLGHTKEAIADCTRAIDLPGTLPDETCQALVYRAVALRELDRNQEAIADYSRAIVLPGVSANELSQALVNRGLSLSELGRAQEAIADYTRTIDLPGAHVEDVSRALVYRGDTLSETDRIQEAIADYTRAIALPGAPAEDVARARGACAALLLVAEDWTSAWDQLRRVLAEEANPEDFALVTDEVIAAIFRQTSSPDTCRARLTQTLAFYAEHQVLPVLGEALVRHLAKLSQSHLNAAGLDQWLAGWEAGSAGQPALRLPLRLLRAGIAYLKTEPRSEGVLLDLPREERGLVRQALGLPDEPD